METSSFNVCRSSQVSARRYTDPSPPLFPFGPARADEAQLPQAEND